MVLPTKDPKKTSKMETTVNSVDILEKGSDGWKFKTIKVSDSKMLMDGKPFDPAAMAPPPAAKKP